MSGEAKASGGAVAAAAWLSNPVVVWGGGILAVLLAAYFILPSLFSGFKAGFNKAVDSYLADLSNIIGSNPDQNLNDRSRTDQVTGLLAANSGDRALSDLVDSPLGYIEGLFTGTKK